MSEIKVYLDGKELGSASDDIGEISDTTKIKHGFHMPKSFECKISWKSGYGMEYVDDMRRRRWCNSFSHGGQCQ